MRVVREVMRAPTQTVRGAEMLPKAARTLLDEGVGLLAVADEHGGVVATLSARDIVAAVASGQDATRTRIGQVARRVFRTAGPDDDLGDALATMGESGLTELPICANGRLVGVLALSDLADEQLASAPMGGRHRRLSA